MKQTFTFKTRYEGTLIVETERFVTENTINEIEQQLISCSTGKSNCCDLNSSEVSGKSCYEEQFNQAKLSFNSSMIYDSRMIMNLFKIIYMILVNE